MVYVERGTDGLIKGVYQNRQDGYAEEQLDRGNAEVVAFLNPPQPVPTISKAQALLYLLMIGKTDANVKAAIATISDATKRAIAEIEWDHRLTFHHDHPLFMELGPILGITDMIAAFRIAATL